MQTKIAVKVEVKKAPWRKNSSGTVRPSRVRLPLQRGAISTAQL